MYPTIENGATVLHADEGMVLTNDSTFVSAVRLGKEADESEWYEITKEEAEKRMAVPRAEETTDADYQSALREFGVSV